MLFNDSFSCMLFDSVSKGDESGVLHAIALGVSINTLDEDGSTCLHYTSSCPQSELLVPLLIAKGVTIDTKNKNGVTALHLLAAHNRIYGLTCLLHHGANINCMTTTVPVMTPLSWSITNNSTDATKILLALGANPDIFNDVTTTTTAATAVAPDNSNANIVAGSNLNNEMASEGNANTS